MPFSAQQPLYRLGSLFFVQDLSSAGVVSTAFPAHPDEPNAQIGVRLICGVNLSLVSGLWVAGPLIEGFTAAGAKTQVLANLARGQFNFGDVIDMAAAPGMAVAWFTR